MYHACVVGSWLGGSVQIQLKCVWLVSVGGRHLGRPYGVGERLLPYHCYGQQREAHQYDSYCPFHLCCLTWNSNKGPFVGTLDCFSNYKITHFLPIFFIIFQMFLSLHDISLLSRSLLRSIHLAFIPIPSVSFPFL